MMHYSATQNAFYPSEMQADYIAAGTWPDDAVNVDDETFQIFGLGEPPAGMTRGSDSAGQPCWQPSPAEPIGSVAARQRALIESALSATLAAGMPYTLPDGTDDVIQTRPDEDEANLLGLAIEARDLRAAGETGAVMSLRARSNTVYALTPEQMIALTDAAKAFKQRLLAKSWELKDAVSAAMEAGDREAIETVTWEE
ncbi:DUF4376 domain-containing protein [Salinicola sp. CR57]|uniref:DUF4376 domain-containing protein n=1 Tax=Salinicola sp. CR57 TaxID=1949086 RepID=UPI000DA26198|nr:DUF4376 domain-containing protein [Salinicola sp. CR57]